MAPANGVERTPQATHERGWMSEGVTAGRHAAEPPEMVLVFEVATADERVRPAHVGALLSSIEEIFLVTLLRDAPPPDYHGREWVWDYDAEGLTVRLARTRFDEQLEVVLSLPWYVYTVPYGLAHVFGVPATGAPLFERAREDFWASRLAAANPRPEWMEWQAWLEYKHEQMQRVVPFRLREVDVELTLPPEPPAD
jgi:hypothetical protein